MKEENATIALDYLNRWKYDKENWKFHKKKQFILEKAIYYKKYISKKSFKNALEYFSNVQGNAHKVKNYCLIHSEL
jgi:ribosomal protein L22